MELNSTQRITFSVNALCCYYCRWLLLLSLGQDKAEFRARLESDMRVGRLACVCVYNPSQSFIQFRAKVKLPLLLSLLLLLLDNTSNDYIT